MSADATDPARRIVTCDDCGTPYPAVDRGGDLALVGPEDNACANCDGTAFSRLSLDGAT